MAGKAALFFFFFAAAAATAAAAAAALFAPGEGGARSAELMGMVPESDTVLANESAPKPSIRGPWGDSVLLPSRSIPSEVFHFFQIE